MNLTHIFQRLGMSKNASHVYSHLSQNPDQSPTQIMRDTAMHRPTVYRALRELEQANLLQTTAHGKRSHYSVHGSDHIKKLLLSDITHADKTLKKQKDAADKSIAHNSLKKSLHTYTGDEAVRAVFQDVLDQCKTNETFYRYVSEDNPTLVNSLLPENYHHIRDKKKKLERLVISNTSSAETKRARLERFIKTIDSDGAVFDQNFVQLIYADRIAFIDLTRMESFIIVNASLAAFQKVIFLQLYKKLH